jgi:DNA polymerase-3 subunit delta
MGALCVLREAGETPQRIMHMLARQIRMIAIVRNLIDNGADDNTIRKTLDVHDFVARRVIKQARRYSQSSVDSALECLLACDIAIQNYRNDRPGAMGAEEALDLLVVDLAG